MNNPFGIIRYTLEELSERSCFFPIVIKADDEPVAYTGIQSISDRHTRIRGIYVLPKWRGKGIGYFAREAAESMFPSCFSRSFGFYRENRVDQFLRSGMREVPGLSWFWSQHSEVRMKLLYRDMPNKNDMPLNDFLEMNLPIFGLRGSNNSNGSSQEEWLVENAPHYDWYPKEVISLDFPTRPVA